MTDYLLRLPAMGESIEEAKLITWFKKEGDFVEKNESIVEIATDKVDSEVPSTQSGILKKKLFVPNDIIKVGEPFAIIEIDKENDDSKNKDYAVQSSNVLTKKEEHLKDPTKSVLPKVEIGKTKAYDDNEPKRFYSPLIRNICKEENIALITLDSIEGSARNGRLTKDDLLCYLQGVNLIKKKGETKTQMSRIRKIICEKMLESKRVSAHVTSVLEADLSNIVKWREEQKNRFREKNRTTLSYMPFFISAVVKAIIDFPVINSRVDGEYIITNDSINIGIATALKDGNLIVPVIKNADEYKNIKDLSIDINNLVKKARESRLDLGDTQKGTYTISNIGSFGNLFGTPIINQPEVAILAVGVIEKKPSVVETKEGDFIAIRHKMYLSHTYDHRIIDGAVGGMFLKKVAQYLEDFDKEDEFYKF